MQLSGKGTCLSTPVRVKGVQQLILFVDPKDQPHLTLEINPVNFVQSPPAIETIGGSLEITGLRVRVNPNTQMPSLVQVYEGDLTMTRCNFVGPLSKPSDAFQSLVSIRNLNAAPATLLLRDNILLSGKTLIHMQENVQIRARNNVGVALSSGIVIDANRPSGGKIHVLDHNTIAVRHAALTLHQPRVRSKRRHLDPSRQQRVSRAFTDANDQRVFLRVRGGARTLAAGRALQRIRQSAPFLPSRPRHDRSQSNRRCATGKPCGGPCVSSNHPV